MTLIIDMVTGEILEEDRPREGEQPPEAERSAPRPAYHPPQPDLIPVTPEPSEPSPPPFLWDR